jgi:predicted enzyme related to lactoylglutathione lyase
MAEVTSYEPGTPSYIDLATTDLDAAKHFYGALFDWDAQDMPAGDQGIYTMLSKQGKEVAGAYQMNPEMAAQGVPPNWTTYITVADVAAAATAVTASGGTVVTDPFDVMTAGRMAVAQDPTGATFAMWQAKESIGSYLVNEPGTLVWNELQTDDTAACESFYAEVFGWKAETAETPSGAYTSFRVGDRPVAGMMEIRPEWGPVPPNWSIYLAVADCDATIEKAVAMGASLEMEPMDIPDVGRMALLQDPQGAYFYVMTAPNAA